MSAVTDFYSKPDLADPFGATANRSRPHGGLDIPKANGTPIPALFSGVVVAKGISDELGCFTQVKSPNGKILTYCHSQNPSHLDVGNEIRQGESVNKVGARGNATGPHLHLAVGNTTTVGFAFCEDPWPWVQKALNGGDLVNGSSPAIVSSHGIPRSSTEEDGVTGLNFNKRLQLWIRLYAGYTGPLDGSLGTNSWKGIQTMLKRESGYNGPIDGFPGHQTYMAMQRWAARNGYTGPIDGAIGKNTWRALAHALNAL